MTSKPKAPAAHQEATYEPIDGPLPTVITQPTDPIEGVDDKKSLTKLAKGVVLSIAPSAMSDEQIMAMRMRTPSKFIKTFEGRGGKKLSYVPVAIYIRKLNFTYGYGNWSFEVVKSEVIEDGAVVQGRLSVPKFGMSVSQFGGHPVAREVLGFDCGDGKLLHPSAFYKLPYDKKALYTKKHGNYVDVGDSFKAAASDCLKKCCSMLGMFADVYSPDDFAPVADVPTIQQEEPGLKTAKASREQRAEMDRLATAAGLTTATLAKKVREHYKVSITDITPTQADGMVAMLKKLPAKAA